MFEFFKKQKFKKDVRKLENELVKALRNYFPDLAENHEHWALSTISVLEKNEKIIHLLHMTSDVDYCEKNRAKYRKNYKINGVEIFDNRINKPIQIRLIVHANLIQHIYLPFEKNISKEFDLNSIKVNDPQTEIFEIENNDEKILRKILNGLGDNQLQLLEIENTFEIELDNKFYYTIFDMEDGNYIAVDKKGKVYRLIHDHEQPVKKIAEKVEAFLNAYSGDKKGLEKYMDQ
jgi:hypothetical protein